MGCEPVSRPEQRKEQRSCAEIPSAALAAAWSAAPLPCGPMSGALSPGTEAGTCAVR